jgi:hypothetical protein
MKGNNEMKNDKFVKVPNSWYMMDKTGTSFMDKIGECRFTLWFYLQKTSVEMNMSDVIPIQIKQLSQELNDLNGFKKSSYIRKFLIQLKKSGLIECDTLTDKTKPTDLIYIKVSTRKHTEDCKSGFSMINVNIFNDKIKKLNCYGFYIYCFLFKHHNTTLGNQKSSNIGTGYAEANREFIGNVLGIKSVKTISKYTEKIANAKGLIKILPQEFFEETNEFGETVKKWHSNRYIVYPKFDKENKYHIHNINK